MIEAKEEAKRPLDEQPAPASRGPDEVADELASEVIHTSIDPNKPACPPFAPWA